jgi:cell division protein FtsB
MNRRQGVGLSVALLLLAALFFFIIVSEHGLMDLRLLKAERNRLVEENRYLTRENHTIRVEIQRLKHDPQYIESVARRELGMVGRDEVIVKPRSRPDKKVSK